MQERASQGQISLTTNLPENHIVIVSDPKRLKQILLNLLSNAIKFTNPLGTVSVVLEENIVENFVRIIVSDTGIGIAEKDIPKIMSEFGQINNELSKKYATCSISNV